jgi:hypothetical protein
MKYRFIASLFITVSAFAPTQVKAQTPLAPSAGRGPIEVNGIAAKVNGRVITKNQVSFMLAPVYAQLNAQHTLNAD